MIFARFAFLIVVLMSSNIYAQTPSQIGQNNKTQAYKFDEFKRITNKRLIIKYRNFVVEALKNSAQGYMVVFAPDEKRINLRVYPLGKLLRESSRGGIVDFDTSIITIISMKEKNEKTEFWIVPVGAKLPNFEKFIK